MAGPKVKVLTSLRGEKQMSDGEPSLGPCLLNLRQPMLFDEVRRADVNLAALVQDGDGRADSLTDSLVRPVEQRIRDVEMT
jgi:hypothetical protein